MTDLATELPDDYARGQQCASILLDLFPAAVGDALVIAERLLNTAATLADAANARGLCDTLRDYIYDRSS